MIRCVQTFLESFFPNVSKLIVLRSFSGRCVFNSKTEGSENRLLALVSTVSRYMQYVSSYQLFEFNTRILIGSAYVSSKGVCFKNNMCLQTIAREPMRGVWPQRTLQRSLGYCTLKSTYELPAAPRQLRPYIVIISHSD